MMAAWLSHAENREFDKSRGLKDRARVRVRYRGLVMAHSGFHLFGSIFEGQTKIRGGKMAGNDRQ